MSKTVRHSRNPAWMVALACCCLLELSGCSLFVMAGKMLQGDPVVQEEFKAWYGQSMSKSGKKVAVLCSTPDAVKSEFSSLDLDLAAEISRKLALHDINVIRNHKVATWIDDHGGGELDLRELGAGIDADLVIEIRLDHFDYREENSTDLFRGKASGSVVVFELQRKGADNKSKFAKGKNSAPEADTQDQADSKKTAKSKKGKAETLPEVERVRKVFEKTFDSTYPALQPISITQMQPDTFRKKFLDRVGDELSRLFYEHKAGTDI